MKKPAIVTNTEKSGISGAGLGENPLTLWLVASSIILFLYFRRAAVGVDRHPEERKPAVISKPRDTPPAPAIRLQPKNYQIISPGTDAWDRIERSLKGGGE